MGLDLSMRGKHLELLLDTQSPEVADWAHVHLGAKSGRLMPPAALGTGAVATPCYRWGDRPGGHCTCHHNKYHRPGT